MNPQQLTQYEKVPCRVYEQSKQGSVYIAQQIAQLIRDKAARKHKCVLGLATGSSPIGVYAELVRMHKQEGLSFAHVVTFNLDEYYPMKPDALQSYHRFMHEHLFNHVDIPPEQVHIPDGTCPIQQVYEACAAYEQAIADAGGIDLQVLGIGRTGHVGFNEPGSARNSPTRLIALDSVTRRDAAGDFYGEESVPRRAITMGVGSIMRAKRVMLMAWGEGKAEVVARAAEGPITEAVAASFLQEHPQAEFILDQAAAAGLTRHKTPWVVGPVAWDRKAIRKAVTWLARKLDKPILKLTDNDYNEHHLQDLLAEHGPANEINITVFRAYFETITGWPGGKPAERKRPGDIARPADRICPKRVLVFSPHPDDDVISMGGTLIRLVDQGHEVHVAYQVSGNIAVFDADAIRFADFATQFNKMFDIDDQHSRQIERHIEQHLMHKKPGEPDSPQIQRIKGLIRRGEARAAGRCCNIPYDRLHFLDMPFYETGVVRKKPIGEQDVQLIGDLLERIKPHQVYAAGDLSDPHGTHRVCLAAILRALQQVNLQDWFADCEVWLYRGAWQEYEPQEIDMAVPISPPELLRKRQAIFKHQSQKDRAPYPGADPREFWQRAEDRNRATAQLYDALGLAEYEAIEAFAKWNGGDL